jgi:alpha-glucosidase
MLLALAAGFSAPAVAAPALTSPDKHIKVEVHVTPSHTLAYTVSRDGQPVILASSLGLELHGADFTHQLSLASASPVKRVRDSYVLATGKKSHITYTANEKTYTVRNAARQDMQVTFRVSNDGVAFRYAVRGAGLPHKKFASEATSFVFDPSTRAWLQPIAVAQTGFANANPSYEEHYRREIPVGTRSDFGAGWVFPALFRTGDTWVALTEANMDGSFHASRLRTGAPSGTYTVGVPMDAEVFPGRALLAETDGDMVSPWRVIALGSLKTLVESTLGTDLAAPAVPFDAALVRPGHASWSWPLLKDDATVFDVQKRFVDYAADMRWNYTLVDAEWDRRIGYDKLRELTTYAAGKAVGILVWYNSSGSWNQTPQTPKSALLTHEQRVREFARLRDIGVKGIKVDFFAGDGQSMIAYYIGILQDAAQAGLLVNFHGATLPRGWSRTWPNLMSAEAVRGLEYTTFDQKDEDAVPRHVAMLPFTRNLFDPMDFTPMVFGDIPQMHRTTRNGFELAEPVLFLSGIQHFAETPEGMATVPEYVKALLRDLPNQWDDVRFVDGYPGRYAVIARRAGNAWYVAGLSADDEPLSLHLDLRFVAGRTGQIVTDGAGEREFEHATVQGGRLDTTIKPHGGFVAVFK